MVLGIARQNAVVKLFELVAGNGDISGIAQLDAQLDRANRRILVCVRGDDILNS